LLTLAVDFSGLHNLVSFHVICSYGHYKYAFYMACLFIVTTLNVCYCDLNK